MLPAGSPNQHHLDDFNLLMVYLRQIVTTGFKYDTGIVPNPAARGAHRAAGAAAQVRVVVSFTDLEATPPRVPGVPAGAASDGVPTMPSACRATHSTYSAVLSLSSRLEAQLYDAEGRRLGEPLAQEDARRRVLAVPVMVQSGLCATAAYAGRPEMLTAAHEDPRDPGGYFVMNGREKIVTCAETVPFNTVQVHARDGACWAEVISRPPEHPFANSFQLIVRLVEPTGGRGPAPPDRLALLAEVGTFLRDDRSRSGRWRPRWAPRPTRRSTARSRWATRRRPGGPATRPGAPRRPGALLGLLASAAAAPPPPALAGLPPGGHPGPVLARLGRLRLAQQAREAAERSPPAKSGAHFAQPAAAPEEPAALAPLEEAALAAEAGAQLDRQLLPHCGQAPADRPAKWLFLALMVRRLLLTRLGQLELADRDSYATKRVRPAGSQFAMVFKTLFNAVVGQRIRRGVLEQLAGGPERLSLAGLMAGVQFTALERSLVDMMDTSAKQLTTATGTTARNRLAAQDVYRKNAFGPIAPAGW